MMVANATEPEALPPFRTLNHGEGRAFFDDMARSLLGIPGDEFLANWRAGAYAEAADAPGNGDIIYLAMLAARGE